MPTRDGGGTLDCIAIFDCAGGCADGDDPCVNACLNRGTAESVAQATALAECANEAGCTDEACLASSCSDEVLACAGSTPADGGVPDAGGASCTSTAGVPELTSALTGLAPSYASGDDITVSFSVDGDTRRARLAVYDYGSTTLLLQNWAEDVAPSSTVTATLTAGVVGGPSGTYYLTVELCSTSECNTPVVRNTYARAGTDTAYSETRLLSPGTESCAGSIPIAPFTID